MAETGYRFNEGKLRWRNFPMFLMRGLIKVGEAGELKYNTFNFMRGLPVSDTLDSLMRHLDAVTDPLQDDKDSETLQHHLYSVAWNALVAAWMIENRPELDDRLKIEQLNLNNK